MMKHSFLLYAAAGLMIAGAASATTLTVYNEDEYGTAPITSILDASGHSLQNGSAMLGYLQDSTCLSTWLTARLNGPKTARPQAS